MLDKCTNHIITATVVKLISFLCEITKETFIESLKQEYDIYLCYAKGWGALD